jgi:hypothetical protein
VVQCHRTTAICRPIRYPGSRHRHLLPPVFLAICRLGNRKRWFGYRMYHCQSSHPEDWPKAHGSGDFERRPVRHDPAGCYSELLGHHGWSYDQCHIYGIVSFVSISRNSSIEQQLTLPRASKQIIFPFSCRSSALLPLEALLSSMEPTSHKHSPTLMHLSFYQWWQIVGVLLAHSVVLRSNIIWPTGDWAWRLGKSQ